MIEAAPQVVPIWPVHLAGLLRQLRSAPAPADSTRAELWVVLRTALLRYLRGYLCRVPAVIADDLEDLASAKALELLTRAESGAWDVTGRHPGEVAGYLARVARNALLTHGEESTRALAWRLESGQGPRLAGPHTTPEASARAEAAEFVAGIRECVSRLQPRARRIWFLRVFHDMSSREIAAHPDIGLNAAHVDVIAKRVRDQLCECLSRRGLALDDLPAGTYVHLWNSLGRMAGGGLERGGAGLAR